MANKIEVSGIYDFKGCSAWVALTAIEKYNSQNISSEQLKVILEVALDHPLSSKEMERIAPGYLKKE